MAARRRDDETVIIKKYANRRLYDTLTSRYITLDDLYDMVQEGTEFEVRDAKTGEDLTKSVLTQIIFERESRGTSLLPVSFLKQLIRFYEDSVQDFVPPYLESSMQMFMQQQERFQSMMKQMPFPPGSAEAIKQFNPMAQFEQLTKQNMELFQQTMESFMKTGSKKP